VAGVRSVCWWGRVGLGERVHQLAGELGGMGLEAEVAAGELGHWPAQPGAQLGGGVVAGVTVAVAACCGEDSVGVGGQRVEVEFGTRVLAQLVLEPVFGVGVVAWGVGHDPQVRRGEGALTEPGQGRLDAGLAVLVVELGEEVDPLLSIGQ